MNKKITLQKTPLLEISYDNIYMHIVDFNNEKNNQHFYYNQLNKIEVNQNCFKIEDASKKVEIIIEENNLIIINEMISEIRKIISSKEILYPKENYTNEHFKDFKKRYNGYGKEIYSVLKKNKPEIFNKLKFYQDLKNKENSLAEYIDEKTSFAICLDFYSEQINIWNNDWNKEIGFWEENEVIKSVNFIISKI